MFKKLDSVEKKFEDLTHRLGSGQLSPKELRDLSKEQAGLRDTVETYRLYKQAGLELKDAKDMLATGSNDVKDLAKEEIARLSAEIAQHEQKLKILLLPKDPRDEKNTVLEIRAGTGGDEAALFVADLFRMYSRFAEINRWQVEMLSSNPTGKGGFKEVIVLITGDHVYSKLKFESGVHRVQRVPETEASGRIHTSAVSVMVLPEAEDVELNIPGTELRIDVMRSGGAGGQHVNKTESAVRITHLPTNIVVVCQDDRSQHKNKAKAMKVLKTKLLDKMEQERDAKEAAERRSVVGSGDRSEKIRTYNFPQSRVTDHRINVTLHQLDDVLNGNLTPLCEALIAHYQAEALKSSTEI